MSTVPPEGLLSEYELRDRVDVFTTGALTIDHAADCGLFALPIPPGFGGFGMPNKALWSVVHVLSAPVMRSTWQYVRDRLWVAHVLRLHWHVCAGIVEYGTYAQYDFFLPQLAAGKRIG